MQLYERRVNLIAAHTSLTGFLYGLDTGSISPITQMAQFNKSIGQLSSAQQGIYVACILLSASISSLASGHVSDRVSRKYAIVTGGLVVLVGTIISASSPNFASLVVARIITGVGVGQAMSVTTVYLVEIAPPELRGRSASLLQTYIVVGLTAGYFITFGSRNLQNSIAWRIPFIVQSAMALILSVGMITMPFSPRWLVQVGRKEDAQRVLGHLRLPVVAEQEFHEIETSISESSESSNARFMEMFERRYVRRTVLGIFLMICLQMNGIDAILYFAPIFFQQAGFTSERASFLASGVSGIIMVAFTIPAQIWLDRWGRRKPLIIGGLAMGSCFIIIGALYQHFGTIIDGAPLIRQKAVQWLVVVLIYLFVANFAWSWSVVARVYTSEIIPTRLRAKVCAVEQLANWIVNFAIAFTAPTFLRSTLSGPYFLYGLTTVVAGIACFFIPETKACTLEEIEGLFEKDRSSNGSGDVQRGDTEAL